MLKEQTINNTLNLQDIFDNSIYLHTLIFDFSDLLNNEDMIIESIYIKLNLQKIIIKNYNDEKKELYNKIKEACGVMNIELIEI
jgi:hypothetical protein